MAADRKQCEERGKVNFPLSSRYYAGHAAADNPIRKRGAGSLGTAVCSVPAAAEGQRAARWPLRTSLLPPKKPIDRYMQDIRQCA